MSAASMKQLSATATGVAATSIERCYEHLLDVERYPQWYPDGAKKVEVLARDGDGVASQVDAVLAAVAGLRLFRSCWSESASSAMAIGSTSTFPIARGRAGAADADRAGAGGR